MEKVHYIATDRGLRIFLAVHETGAYIVGLRHNVIEEPCPCCVYAAVQKEMAASIDALNLPKETRVFWQTLTPGGYPDIERVLSPRVEGCTFFKDSVQAFLPALLEAKKIAMAAEANRAREQENARRITDLIDADRFADAQALATILDLDLRPYLVRANILAE